MTHCPVLHRGISQRDACLYLLLIMFVLSVASANANIFADSKCVSKNKHTAPRCCGADDPTGLVCGDNSMCVGDEIDCSCSESAKLGSCRCSDGYGWDKNSLACKECAQGFYSEDNICKSCERYKDSNGKKIYYLVGGAYKNGETVLTKVQDCLEHRDCDPGFAGDNCEACPAGTWSNGGKQEQCEDCPDLDNGIYKNPGTEEFCRTDAKRFCFAGSAGFNCTACTAGTYSPAGDATACQECPSLDAGEYTGQSLTSKAECLGARNCPAGYGDKTCSLCRPGSFSPGGASNCNPCPKLKVAGKVSGTYDSLTGLISKTGMDSCETAQKCKAGYGGVECQQCFQGKFSTQDGTQLGRLECRDCEELNGRGEYEEGEPNQFVLNDVGCARARNCNPGYGGKGCEPCGPGQYSLGGINEDCQPCLSLGGHGTWTEGIKISQEDCDAAVVCNAGYGGNRCERCDVDEYATAGSNTCEDCGDLGNNGGYSLAKNPLVAQTDEDEDFTCDNYQRCDAGYGNQFCDQCPIGKFSKGDRNGLNSCLDCFDLAAYSPVRGTYKEPTAATLNSNNKCDGSRQCAAGHNGKGGRRRECRPCSKEKWSAGGDSGCTDCNPLDSGNWADAGPKTSQQDCTDNRVCGAGYGGASCSRCEPGKYAKSGDNECSDCVAGGLTAGEWLDTKLLKKKNHCNNAHKCTAGYGGEGCLQCPEGKFSTGQKVGIDGCRQCPTINAARGDYLTGDDRPLLVWTAGMDDNLKCKAARNCNPGFDGSDNQCKTCGTNRYSLGGNNGCQPCPELDGEGSYHTKNLGGIDEDCSNTRMCAAGHDGASPTCKACEVGWYSTGGQNTCDECPPIFEGNGNYSTFGTQMDCADARNCKPGYNGEDANCTQCLKGQYSLGGDAPCIACPALEWGYVGPATSKDACVTVQNCPAGTDGTLSGCLTACEDGEWSEEGPSGCSPCTGLEERGDYSGPGLDDSCDTVRNCFAGFDGTTEDCALCDAAEYSLGGLQPCEPCEPMYSEDAGVYTAPDVEATCATSRSCNPGFDGESEGCQPCGSSFWSDGGACQPCEGPIPAANGEYIGDGDTENTCAASRNCFPSFNGDSTTCEPCGDGLWSTGGGPGEEAGSCKPCTPLGDRGSYTGPDVESTCAAVRNCLPGYNGATEDCAPCDAAEYSLGGLQPCEPCEPMYSEDAGVYTAPDVEATCATSRSCNPGFDGESEGCQPCGSSFWSDGGACQPCEGPIPAANGEYIGDGDTENTCAASRNCFPSFNGDSITCEPCGDGLWSTGGGPGEEAGSCKPCTPLGDRGSYTGPDVESKCAAVRNCLPGYNATTQDCASCMDGWWSSGGGPEPDVASCQECPELDDGWYRTMVLPSAASCPEARTCALGYGGDTCTLCGETTYSAPDTGEEANCDPCPPAADFGAGWEYYGSTGLSAETGPGSCEWDRVCSAGYGGSGCSICATGKFMYGPGPALAWRRSIQDPTSSPGDNTPECRSCEDANFGKPPNSEYRWTGTDAAKHADPNPACEYICAPPYSNGWPGGACDSHPLCADGQFFSDSFNPSGGNGSCWDLQQTGFSFRPLGGRPFDRRAELDDFPKDILFFPDFFIPLLQLETFEEARASCVRKGGDLVEVRGADDHAVLELVRDTWAWMNGRPRSSANPFFGLSDRLSEDTWYHLDGTTVADEGFSNWATGQPDDDELVYGEDCAILGVEGNDGAGKWFDVPCNSQQPFACALPTAPAAREPCSEDGGFACHVTAECTKVDGEDTCSCPAGFVGSGDGESGCDGSGYVVRFNMFLPASAAVLQPNSATTVTAIGKLLLWEVYREEFASLLTQDGFRTGGNNDVEEGIAKCEDLMGPCLIFDGPLRRSLPQGFVTSMDHAVVALADLDEGYASVGSFALPLPDSGAPAYMLTVNAVFGTEAEAEEALEELEFNLAGNQSWTTDTVYPTVFGVELTPDMYPNAPGVYRWVAETTSAEQQIQPTGMVVEGVHFEPACEDSGCWVVDILFTIGESSFNTFYIPQAVGSDSASFDFDYDAVEDVTWGRTPWSTFFPNAYPCRTLDYDPEEYHPFKPVNPPAKVTSCCIPEAIGMYRPIQDFSDYMSSVVTKTDCDQGIVPVFARSDWNPPEAPGPAAYEGSPVGNCSDVLTSMPGEVTDLGTTCYVEGGDSGELSAAYTKGDNVAWKLIGKATAGLQVVFNFFETTADEDVVRIYQCSSASCDELILLAEGSGAYNPFAVTSCSGYMLITLESTGSTAAASGFQARWNFQPQCSTSTKSLRAPALPTDDDPTLNREATSEREIVATPPNYFFGMFKGLVNSYMTFVSVVDPYIGQYRARAFLDEVELRRNAGVLRGTVGVEHTVDTFIGLANFKPTGLAFLDPFATQTALHLEKTSFFSVSTHGVNDYTFLEYVNLRLVAVYSEDTDPTETVSENAERTARTDTTGAAHYLQVTFTLGAQYKPIETGLIPMDSVRVAQGTFFSDATQSDGGAAGFKHACSEYEADDGSFDGGNQALFNSRFAWDEADGDANNQLCSPNAQMCSSPSSIPDQFVVFNVPLGIDWLPASSDDLSANVFVDLVVSAIDTAASQMKTTLSASIPVVDGGLNIFCDQLTAKTDLQDVVNADLILGSAGMASELSQLTILANIASSDLDELPSQSFGTTASIQAGLMTLVIKGNSSYFTLGGTGAYAVQLEDVVSIHIMEATKGREDGNKMDQVMDLLETAGDDNNDASGLITGGYALNGAFDFEIDRVGNRAYLEPSDALLALCPFNPARPTSSTPFPTTCVLRRDIQRQSYPFRLGGYSTAVEIPGEIDYENPTADRSQCGLFMQTLMGQSDYADELGRNFSLVVAETYGLNDRFVRAFWINPGYEWTPTQTGAVTPFSVSQKVILFALINLDEGFDASTYYASNECNYRLVGDPDNAFGSSCVRRSLPAARRLLLTSLPENQGSDAGGLGGAAVQFEASPLELMQAVYDVSADGVATVRVGLQLTQREACMSAAERLTHLDATMKDYFLSAASSTETVSLLGVSVNLNGVECRRRALPRHLLAFSAATAAADVVVVFVKGSTPGINTQILESMPGVTGVAPIEVPTAVTVSPTFTPEASVAPRGPNPSDDDGGSNVGLIAGIVGGLVGALLVGAGGVLLWKSRRQEDDAVPAVQALNTQDLKAQLVEEL